MLNLINLVRNVTKAVQERNIQNPEVKTADPSIFDKLNERLESEQAPQNNDSHIDMFERMKKHVEEVKYDNECDEECETAEPSVFEDLQREIEILKQKVDAQEANDFTGQQSDSWTPQNSGVTESYAPKTSIWIIRILDLLMSILMDVKAGFPRSTSISIDIKKRI